MKPVIQHVRFSRLKACIAALITSPFVGKLIGVLFGHRIPACGLSVYTDEHVAPSVNAMLFWGIYESAEIQFVKEYLRPDLDVIELGSSIGVVSCHIARKIVNRKLVCLEANKVLIDVLENNLRINFPDADVSFINAAIDYTVIDEGSTKFFIGATNMMSSLHLPEDEYESVVVDTVTLSTLIERFALREYSLVMDIEGAEIGILMQDRESLASCRQIIAELHSTNYHGKDFTVDDLVYHICENLGFSHTARRGQVCVFNR